MKTDSLFYRLFQSAPILFFELIGQSSTEGYRFDSVEVKQTAFRLDGVFLPPATTPEQPVYFVEVQFQKDEQLYGRLFAEIFLYLRYHPEVSNWRAVVIYAKQSFEPEPAQAYQTLLDSPIVRRFYLDRFPDNQPSLGVELLQLVVEPTATAATQARQLLSRSKQAPIPSSVIRELVETIIVYKFPQLSRQEVAQMLGIAQSIKETRVYQEGKFEGTQSLILKQLTRRLGSVPTEVKAQVEVLSIEQLESLAEALLDFSSLEELQRWLETVPQQ